MLATDGATDAVAFAAHSLTLNDAAGEVAHATWADHGDQLAERGPFDLVLRADVLYTPENADAAACACSRGCSPPEGGPARRPGPHERRPLPLRRPRELRARLPRGG